MSSSLDIVLVLVTVTGAGVYLFRHWFRRAPGKGSACGSGCCCPEPKK